MALTTGEQWTLYLLMGQQYVRQDPVTHLPIYMKSQFRTDAESFANKAFAQHDPNYIDTGFRQAVHALNSNIDLSAIHKVTGFDEPSLHAALGLPYSGTGPCPPTADGQSIYTYLSKLP